MYKKTVTTTDNSILAEEVGLEPTTNRLTAGCSTIELLLMTGPL